MVDAHCLEAPWSLFDDVPTILASSRFHTFETRRESKVKGVRRHDMVEFEVSYESSHVSVWLERRLGNKTMFVMVAPGGKQSGRNTENPGQLAERVVNLLMQHGAFDPDG